MKEQTSRRTFLRQAALTGLAGGLALPDAVAGQCAAEGHPKGLRLLFQGDSITDGNRGRSADPNHIMGHGYAFTIASRLGADFPDAGLSFYNRGISGNKVPDLTKRWQNDTLELRPDVLSLLVGINDTGAVVNGAADAASVEQFAKGYRGLLEDSRALNSDMVFMLGLPFVLPVAAVKNHWEAWREGVRLRGEVVRKLAAQFDAVLVDYQAVFDAASRCTPADYWVWDGIHPTVAGHELMAREWIRQAATRLPLLRSYRY